MTIEWLHTLIECANTYVNPQDIGHKFEVSKPYPKENRQVKK